MNTVQVRYRTKKYGTWVNTTLEVPNYLETDAEVFEFCVHNLNEMLEESAKQRGGVKQTVTELKIKY